MAVEVGLLLAAVFFIRNMTELSDVRLSEEHTAMPHDDEAERLRKVVPPGVLIYRLYGALFFGIADKLENVLKQQNSELVKCRLEHERSDQHGCERPARARRPA